MAINEAFGHNCNVISCPLSEFPSKVARSSFSVLDKTKIKNTLGVEIPHWSDSMQVFNKIISLE